MPEGALRERARARRDAPVDQEQGRPQRQVLAEREHEGEPPLLRWDAVSGCIERDAEEGAVPGMDDEAEGRFPRPTSSMSE